VPFLSNHSDTQDNHHSPDQQTKQSRDHQPSQDGCKQKAMTICSNSARAMCIVAQKYRQTFGSFKLSPITATHCMLSAALIIIEKCCVNPGMETGISSQTPRGPSPQTAVGLCLQVLRELSTSWNIAKRIGRNLEKLYCQRLHCDIDHMPTAPSLECNVPFTASSQPADLNVCAAYTAPQAEPNDSLDPSERHVQNTLLIPPLANLNWFDVSASRNIHEHHSNSTTGFGIVPNPDELFVNNLGFAFSADSLPSDYNMFDTLNQMYLEDIW
jgi:hypothetical protein